MPPWILYVPTIKIVKILIKVVEILKKVVEILKKVVEILKKVVENLEKSCENANQNAPTSLYRYQKRLGENPEEAQKAKKLLIFVPIWFDFLAGNQLYEL